LEFGLDAGLTVCFEATCILTVFTLLFTHFYLNSHGLNHSGTIAVYSNYLCAATFSLEGK